MILRHATTSTNATLIRTQGLRVACADPNARTQGCWLHSQANSAWATVHTLRKHGANLDDVVILEVSIPRSWLTRFRQGLWFTTRDIPATRLTGREWAGTHFGASASE